MSINVSFRNIEKSYHTEAGAYSALQPISLDFKSGEFVGLVGRSGSGKSTLLNILSGIDRPSAGSAQMAGNNMMTMSESELAAFRGQHIGIVFQFFQLIPTLNVLDNVVLAMDMVGAIPRKQRVERALDLLEQVGVYSHSRKLPAKLSGGEQQRVAIARALANDPPVLIADEPTGNLDSENSERIMSIFEKCSADNRLVILATHALEHQSRFSRVLSLKDGVLDFDTVAKEPLLENANV